MNRRKLHNKFKRLGTKIVQMGHAKAIPLPCGIINYTRGCEAGCAG